MKQAIIKKGIVVTENVPAPVVSDGALLIKVMYSAISAGTEMIGVTNSGTSLIKRALKQPQNVAKVFNMMKNQGLFKTYNTVKNKLDTGAITGYSISGVVVAIGKGVKGFKPGDVVAAAGAGIANHAEYVDVPVNLVVKMPKKLDFKYASTVALGSIAMHGIRRADLRMGEYAVVLGLGILGQLALQMLITAGIRVAAIDLDDRRLEIAKTLGADIIINPQKIDPVKAVKQFTGGYGADAVIFTAATSSSGPLSQAFQMTRKKGKVVLVGVSGMEIKREDIYKNEIDFCISSSYGPGRYDEKYEAKGCDYPYPYVRWTENRNMAEYLRLISIGKIKLEPIIDGIYSIKEVTKAFKQLKRTRNKPLILLLEYDKTIPDSLKEFTKISEASRILKNPDFIISKSKKKLNVALIGAGAFAQGMHLPNLQKLNDKFNIYAIADKNGVNAQNIGKKYGAAYSTTDYKDVLNDKNVDMVMICTRHNLHGQIVLESLKAGKHTFVEKPLCTTESELKKIEDFFNNKKETPVLMVGFNRRFSKFAVEAKRHTDKRINPLFIHYRMNAGYIPLDHWVHSEEGGGRIIGEGCHIIDLFSFFTESKVISVNIEALTPKTDYFGSSDNKAIVLKYEDGSVAVLEYFAVGSKKLQKETMDIYFDEKTIIMNDYKNIKGFDVKVKQLETRVSDKGHQEEIESLYNSIIGKSINWPISLDSMIETTKISFLINKT